MPGRLRQSAEHDAETPSSKKYNIPGIEFDEPLSWRAGQTIPVRDLLDRLQKLQAELMSYEEDDVEREAFTKLGADLASTNLLGHKDKGVRAWTVACVVDLLRICAPHAPFTGSQLKDIFTVITSSILPALEDPEHAYNTQHYYVLKSLTEFKSIILISDIDRPDKLIENLVTSCFDIVSGAGKRSSDKEVSKTVEFHLSNLLAIVVDEVDVSQDITDIILSQFLRIDPTSVQQNGGKKKGNAPDEKQGKLLGKDFPPAYNMAKAVCAACADRMLSLIGVYFANIIVDASSSSQTNGHFKSTTKDGEEAFDEDSEELSDLRKAHKLIRELWRACPDIVANVIPQVESELSSGNVSLRVLATQTLGDLTAGIGIAGLPPTTSLDPAAYPLPSVDSPQTILVISPILAPRSAKPFAAVHSSAFSNFLTRKQDRSSAVRSAWATAAAGILSTSAGGVSLSDADQEALLNGLAKMINDPEEKVRLAAVLSLSAFDYTSIVSCLGANGGVSQSGSVLSALAERCKDKKQPIRDEAMKMLARIWGVASADVENGNAQVVSLLAEAPSCILGTYYLNDTEIRVLLDKVLHESLLPVFYPPAKVQISRTDSQKQRAKGKEAESQEGAAFDPDAIRVRRLLTLVKHLDARTKPVFFATQNQQVQLSKAIEGFLRTCEQYNGGVMEGNEDAIKTALGKQIDFFAKMFPDPSKISADLWKFANMHDRRNYQLIRFTIGAQHDYKTVTKAIKELWKRIGTGPTSTQSVLETLTLLLYRSSLLVYNRSNVPSIMEIAHSDEAGLADVANEVLKEISSRCPEVLKTHILDLCRDLEANAPSASQHEEPSAADSLKACASFARKYPSDIPTDRKFLTALTHYSLFSTSPRASKHAVSVVLIVADKKETFAKEILQKALKDCKPSSPHFLARLAAIAQICLLAPSAANSESEKIVKLAVTEVLQSTSKFDTAETATMSKELALKIMVNRCRSEKSNTEAKELDSLVNSAYSLIARLIKDDGEISPRQDTPPNERHKLKLAAARFMLKLCRHQRRCEELLTAPMFIDIAAIVLNPPNEVRVGFVSQLKKYLGQNRLNYRWFTILFLLAFEPDEELKNSTVTWLKSRVQYYTRAQQQAKSSGKSSVQPVMESVFARLLSLLAHHPDYPEKDSQTYGVDLLDFSKYICFYLSAVANEDNLSLIFHISQRVKQTLDAVSDLDETSERLYVLSDLAQATIRNWADTMTSHMSHARGINLLQTWPGKVTLPTTLFKALPNHESAQQIAEKNFLPEDVNDGLERLVRAYAKASKGGQHATKRAPGGERKRKTEEQFDSDEDDDHRRAKKTKKSSNLPIRKASGGSTKTPKPKRKGSELPSSELPSRKSSRVTETSRVKYAERDSSEDEAEMEEIDRLASSPAQRKSRKVEELTSSSPTVDRSAKQDTPMTDVPVPNTNHDKENEAAATVAHIDDLEEDEDDAPPVSPLKEKGNKGAHSKKKMAKKATEVREETFAAKASPARASPRTTRSTKV